MMNTIDMQQMRYLNLFGKITKVNAGFCFKYNEAIVFGVPKPLMSRAVGEDGKNVKKINGILGRKIKVVPKPRGIQDAKDFIKAVVSPVKFRNLETNGNEIILTAGMQSKAALIGRNKRRFLEMQKIVKDFFGKEFRII